MPMSEESVVSITAGVPFSRTFELIESIQLGLPYASFEILERHYKVSRAEFSTMIGLSTSAARRRKLTGKMHSSEGEKIVRYARLFDVALGLMEGNNDRALRWLNTPARALGGVTPLAHSITGFGAQQVEHLIGRIEHGVVS